jgi:hypothetical protein
MLLSSTRTDVIQFISLLFSQARVMNRETYKQEMREAREQQQIAEQERKRMEDFDEYLVLAKYNP